MVSDPLAEKIKARVLAAKQKHDAAGAPDPRMTKFADYLRGQRNADIDQGMTKFGQYFGAGNPEMAAILRQRQDMAFGGSHETDAAKAAGSAEINRQMATGLRQLRGSQAAAGVRGGAAIGQSLPVLQAAANARGKMEADLSTAEMARRRGDLNAYESSLTGERAGLLGSAFGNAGLGSSDRSNGMQYQLGQDFLKHAQDQLAAAKAAQAGIAGPAAPGQPKPAWWTDIVAPMKGGMIDRWFGNDLPPWAKYLNPAEVTESQKGFDPVIKTVSRWGGG